MAKDPAFLFYPGDWMTGTMTMTRHQKGCYIDLLIAQFNNGPLSLETIKTVLGTDQAIWTVLSKKFKQDSHGNFFSERLATEIEKRKVFTNSRRQNGKGKKEKAYAPPYAKHKVKHTENRNENENLNFNKNGVDLSDYEKWTEDASAGRDHVLEQMLMRENLTLSKKEIVEAIKDHFGLLSRYPKMQPQCQQAFRNSLIKHIKEFNPKNKNGNHNQASERVGRGTKHGFENAVDEYERRHSQGNN